MADRKFTSFFENSDYLECKIHSALCHRITREKLEPLCLSFLEILVIILGVFLFIAQLKSNLHAVPYTGFLSVFVSVGVLLTLALSVRPIVIFFQSLCIVEIKFHRDRLILRKSLFGNCLVDKVFLLEKINYIEIKEYLFREKFQRLVLKKDGFLSKLVIADRNKKFWQILFLSSSAKELREVVLSSDAHGLIR